ncbi:MAG: hypothetical protein EZS28_001233 [Streblomastix strix]|uniref:OTU domain-containing protein n=1 Tax=Streblomastix strix TaxID=222440 RepID=A0A5J4X7Q5_9EUKA|nr:MAG: hypothetical protein EZS28_001233 [Streblomastix strix]
MMMILCSIDAYQEVTTLSNRKSSFECTGLSPWSRERACISEYIKDVKDNPIYTNGRIMKGHDASFALLVPGWINHDEICIKVKINRDFTNNDENQEDFHEEINFFEQEKQFKQENKRKRFRISESQSPKSSPSIRNTSNSGANVKRTQRPGVTAKRAPSSVSFVNQLPDIGSDGRDTSNFGATVKRILNSDKVVKNELNSGSITRKSPNVGQIGKLASSLSFEEMQEELVSHDTVLFNNRGDGNCFYMSISNQLHGTNKMHGAIRQAAVKELIENRLIYEDDFDEETLDQYARNQSQERDYADARIYLPTCRDFNINLRVYLGAGKVETTDIGSTRWVEIAYVNGNHYVSVI